MTEISGSRQKLTTTQIIGIIVGALYVSGYYINSVFIRNYGISENELLRLEYIKIGFVFALITFGIVFLPVGSFYLTYKVRTASRLPHFHLGAIGNALNTILFLGYPLFLAFFATQHEFELLLPESTLGIMTFEGLMITSLSLSAFAVILLPAIERIVATKTSGNTRMMIFRMLIEPFRYGIFVLTIFLVTTALSLIPWMTMLASRGVYYFLAGMVFVSGMTAAALWVKKIRSMSGSGMVYPLIGLGVSILYYMTITSYVFGVYTFIPSNRGGKLPVTEAYLLTESHFPLLSDSVLVDGRTLRGPVYVIDENNNSLFVASQGMNNWNTDFVPVHMIKRDQILYTYLKRIKDGFPRSPRILGSR